MDPTGPWSRRRFIGASADAALIATVAGALKPLAAVADTPNSTVTLYDPRFDAAAGLARSLAGDAPVQPAGTDPTDLVLHLADAAPGALRLQGVTTESVPFCLRQLLPDARYTERRVDRDLFIWTLDARS